jgi:hypothetical protein
MVADIARVTYDPTRQYRSLIYQQGRVTLEADNNEGAALEGEALRLETIDIFGPATAIGAGYEVSSGTGPGGVIIGAGIFYLGGWRLDLEKAIDLSTASDIQVADFAVGVIVRQGAFVVSLLITEQSVCAVEDQALREVALGGPDSAARSRLMQRFPRIPIDGATCDAGATAVAALLQEDGVTIDPYSLQLLSSATLQAGFVPGPANTDPCTPAAAGGYLGADNQMVRVTVTQFDAAKQTGVLLWGWNNASLLYRATATDPLTLTLTNTPVDEEHAPQQNQMVEILRSELNLADNNYIAEGQGFVTSLAQGYSFDTGEIVLADPLPAAYQNNKNPLFVRLWQAEVPFNTDDPTALDDVSGITVSINMTALPTHIAARPFWRFAVRPATPQNIYPQRYADKPQPPDGPRQWITDLAVCEALESGVDVLEDCRNIWGGQDGGGCCGLVLGPDDVAARGGLQVVVDALAAGPAVLSLRPGVYPLAAPLVLQKNHNGLVIEGCCPTGAQLTAAGADLTPFRTGLIVLDGVENITLRQLEIVAPAVPVNTKNTKVQLSTLCGVMVAEALYLTIEGCTFPLTAPSATAFGGGILVFGPTLGVTLSRNWFTAGAQVGDLLGVLALVTDSDASAELDQWDIVDNRFDNLAFAVVGFAQLGLVGCRHNVAAGCGAGFVFAEANLGATAGFTNAALNDQNNAALGFAANAAMRPDILAGMAATAAPIMSAKPSTPAVQAISSAAAKVLSDQLNQSGVDVYQQMTSGAATADPAAPAPEAGAKASGKRGAAKGASVDTSNFEAINAIAVAAEVSQRVLTPAIRLEDNEVTLTAGATAPWVGLAALLSPDEPGSVIVNGNRVVVPDATTVACAVIFPAGAVVSGNLFAQSVAAPAGTPTTPCLIVLSRSPAIMVGSNVASFTELVTPQRSPPSTAIWDFLNTTG